MDHPTVELMSRVLGRIDGIVGMSFFGRYRTTIDYQAKELTFVPSGFVPPDAMDNMMKNLMNAGNDDKQKVVRPAGLLGIEVARDKDDTRSGVRVTRVLAGGPAARAGLLLGDRLLVLDDRWTDSVIDCFTAASHLRPGTTVHATILRDGKEKQLTIGVDAGL
jgi:S1-C subfamily serine protease